MSKRAKAKLGEARSTQENRRSKPSVNPATKRVPRADVSNGAGRVQRAAGCDAAGESAGAAVRQTTPGGWSANTKMQEGYVQLVMSVTAVGKSTYPADRRADTAGRQSLSSGFCVTCV